MNPLTAREKTVLSLVSSGLTTKQIADTLKVSYHTVETHRRNLRRKCAARNSAELVRKATTMEWEKRPGHDSFLSGTDAGEHLTLPFAMLVGH